MPKLLDRVSDLMRTRHYSRRTEQAYAHWIRRYVLFHRKQHPAQLGAAEVSAFLSHLARTLKVSSSTQNQALAALLFLYREVFALPLPRLSDVERAKSPVRMPVVFTPAEVERLLAHLSGTNWLMAGLLYGAGLRLQECVTLRVKDIDFGYRQIAVRDGKGAKDRVTILPASLYAPLQSHLGRVKALHEHDLARGYGRLELPYALGRKYPAADREWAWQYAFPSARLSADRRDGVVRRYHAAGSAL